MTTVGVGVATFGSSEWKERGLWTQKQILNRTAVDDIAHVHSDSLASARNELIEILDAEYIVLVDADDLVCDNYCDILKSYIIDNSNVLYQPSTIGLYEDGTLEGAPTLIPDRDMNISNNLVIGTAFRKDCAGIFDSSLHALEDWDFFLQMLFSGAKIKQCPNLVYEVGIFMDNSRNNNRYNHDAAYSIIRKRRSGRVSGYLV